VVTVVDRFVVKQTQVDPQVAVMSVNLSLIKLLTVDDHPLRASKVLTPCEIDVLQFLADGMTNKEVADHPSFGKPA
jgi:DNA-binding NarL/FixJ family response regulator